MESFIELAEILFVLGLMIYAAYALFRNIIQKQKNQQEKPSPADNRRRLTEIEKSMTQQGGKRIKNQIPKVPIKTIEQAKEFFMYAQGAHYHMWHDHPKRYKEYMLLNIPRQDEDEWRKEMFYEIYSDILSSSDYSFLWHLHSNLADLYEYLKSNEELMKVLEVTNYLFDKVPVDDRVIIAETINGRARRQDRGGLIYTAYDSGNIEAAKELAKLSLLFSSFSDNNKNERNQRATRLCTEIMNELGLQ